MARSTKTQMLLLTVPLLVVLAGCSGNQVAPAAQSSPVTLSVSANQTADVGIGQASDTNTVTNSSSIFGNGRDSGNQSNFSQPSTDSEYDVSNLELTLPKGWNLNTEDRFGASLTDENGVNLGSVVTYPYADDFDFKFYKPNHSEITNEEAIDTPIGSGKLYTLDADNGTAASGLTGTHDVYFAVIPIQDKIIYVLEFSKHDKEAASKKQFVGLLNGLRLKK
ncbi:hypothetical protein EXW96_01195 [Paenibacillus sp. JMULE4]|uniref:hypothetical protein n=1 Tax=Paenibacillus TaxID=44249 RepID=UPI00087F8A02|nr:MULTISPECIES: hypothetical protein [Paenibacillus]NTZ16248.1 hypothetical protein [Paenibacillus sp. JMULE4]SDJ93907.1 hypothetical protein SAMN05421868_1609 [Paenibacillus naphthalenovorans]